MSGMNKPVISDGPLDVMHTVAWLESIWDLAPLLYSSALDTGTSILASLLILAVTAAQIAFCVSVYIHLGKPVFHEALLEDANHFRKLVGHDVRYQDPVTKHALMRGVCEGRSHLPLGTAQRSLLDAIEAYLSPDDDLDAFFGGPCMTVLALASWTLVYLTHLQRGFHLAFAFQKLKRERITTIKTRGGRVMLESLSTARLVIGALVMLVRVGLVTAVFLNGALWMCYEVNIAAILLNAVALGFVLDLDSMLFAIAPKQAKRVLRALEPLQVAEPMVLLGLDVESLLQVLFITIASMALFATHVQPHMDQMHDIRAALCEGNLDFLFTQDASLGLTYLSSTENATIVVADDIPTIQVMESVAEAVAGASLSSSTYLTHALVAEDLLSGSTINAAAIVAGLDTAGLVNLYNPLCLDGVWDSITKLKSNFASMMGISDPSLVSCSSQSHLWHSDSWGGTYLRMACPVSAGCTHTLSPVKSLAPEQGCPAACSDAVATELARRPCEDQDVKETDYWTGWVDFIAAAAGPDNSALAAQLLEQGCSFLARNDTQSASVTPFQLCTGSPYSTHPLAFACPVSCGCRPSAGQALLEFCPGACAAL